MNNIKGLQGALWGGAALMAMTSGVQADELAALKGQLESLQSRVDSIEQAPAQGSQGPIGGTLLTFERGSRMAFVAPYAARDRGNANDDGGFTIAITPSADMPAPVAEIAPTSSSSPARSRISARRAAGTTSGGSAGWSAAVPTSISPTSRC